MCSPQPDAAPAGARAVSAARRYVQAGRRKLAESMHFVNARKHDSQDICFVPDGDYVKFMEQYTGKTLSRRGIFWTKPAAWWAAPGAARYTLGQRARGGAPYGAAGVCVRGSDMARNTVTVGPKAPCIPAA